MGRPRYSRSKFSHTAPYWEKSAVSCSGSRSPESHPIHRIATTTKADNEAGTVHRGSTLPCQYVSEGIPRKPFTYSIIFPCRVLRTPSMQTPFEPVLARVQRTRPTRRVFNVRMERPRTKALLDDITSYFIREERKKKTTAVSSRGDPTK